MDLSLRPETRAALQAFRTRHQSLLQQRGLLIALLIALITLSVIALLDRAWLMPDVIRPWFSLAAYAACAVFAWKLAWRFIAPAKTDTGSASLAEGVAPEVREQLLAAVELAQVDPASIKDSPEFRARLQDDVATSIKGIDWRARQPNTPLVPWLKRIGLACLIIGALSFVPRLHLPGFLARAALPFANLPRPSSVQITIEKPAKPTTPAAIGSEMGIEVSITGERVATAVMEYGEVGGSTSRMELTQASPQRFETRLPVGQNDVRFRIHASDGISEWHTLEAKARPRITQFVKTIVPPAYVGGKPTVITDDTGDLEVLTGSSVQLAMQCNQPVSEARIVLNPDMPTHPEAPKVGITQQTKLDAKLDINDQSEAWTVRMKSAETEFSNDDAASWRITVVPDLPPVVQITEPLETQISLLADESLRISGAASDDVGLASVKLAHVVNGTDSQEIELTTKPGKETTVQHLLQLAPMHLKAGDTVLLKLIAIDLKGQKAESPALRLIILEQTIDPKQRQWAREQQRLAEAAKTLEDKTKELIKDASSVQKVAKAQKSAKKAAEDPETKLARFQQSLDAARTQANDLWEQLKKAAQAAPDKLAAQEAQLLGEQVAKLRNDSLRRMEDLTKDGTIEQTEAVKQAAAQAHNAASAIEDGARSFAAATAASIADQAARQMVRQQTMLTQTSLDANRDNAQRGKWQEQQRAAVQSTASVREEFDTLRAQVHGGHQATLDRLNKEIADVANDVTASLDKPADPKATEQPQAKSPEHLYSAADNLRNRLQRSAEAVRAIADETQRRAAEARERLHNIDNPALVALEQAQQALQDASNIAKDPKRLAKQKTDKEGNTAAERAHDELARASKQLQDQAELREQNPLTNTEAALDANRASRAAEKLREQTAKAEDAPSLEAAMAKVKELAQVARVLDANNIATEAASTLADAAADATKPDSDQAKAVADAAQQAAEQLRQLPNAARRANAPNDLANTAQQASDQARSAAQQLNDQVRQALQRPPNQPAPAMNKPAALADAKAKVDQVAAALAQQAQTARGQLLAMAPKLSDMMKKVASDLGETQKKTEDAKQDADAQKPVADVADKARAIQPDAASDAEKMQALQAALRQEANAAELAKADQRQLARTADVALEAMRQKSPQIQANLKQAAKAQESKPQATALANAAQAQKQTAEALQQLAQNFDKMEKGETVPQEALDQLAQMEQQLGVQEPLDEAYDQAKALADTAQDAQNDPQKALANLEKQLAKSPAMQKALATIAKDTAQAQEKTVAEKANQPTMLSMVADDAAHNLERVARHEQRLNQQTAAKQAADAGAKLKQTAQATKTDVSKATPQVAQDAKAAAQAAAQSAEQAATQAPTPPNISAFEQTQAQSLAQALDQLDAQLHPQQSGQPPQGQQQKGQEQAQQNAQQSLAQAQQSQQQQMAQSRADGKVPGQSQSQQQQQTAQNQQKSNQQADSATSQDGGNYTPTNKDGKMVMVPVNVGSIVVTDWGKLPARMAEDLTEATRQEAAPEYRAAIESYYKAIASKAKK